MTRKDWHEEPARQPDYRRLYRQLRTWQEAVEDRLDYLTTMVKELEELMRGTNDNQNGG